MTDLAYHPSALLRLRRGAIAHIARRPALAAASAFSATVMLTLSSLATVSTFAVLSLLVPGQVLADDKPVYRCPGNLYTDAITAKEARDKGCKTLDGAPITVIQSVIPKGSGGAKAAASASPNDRISSDDQKARDSDRRKILEAELRKEEEALSALQKEYNNGQPERKGDERNFQKYQDRVNDMKAAITRKEADVAALRRELGTLGASAASK